MLRDRAMAGVGLRTLPLRQGRGALGSCRKLAKQSPRRTRCQCESSDSTSDSKEKKKWDIKSTIGNIDSLLGIEEEKEVWNISPALVPRRYLSSNGECGWQSTGTIPFHTPDFTCIISVERCCCARQALYLLELCRFAAPHGEHANHRYQPE